MKSVFATFKPRENLSLHTSLIGGEYALTQRRFSEAVMSSLPVQVLVMLGETIEKVVPITIVLALLFSVLSHFWACNQAAPWWRKRELVTDTVYWFFVPVFARVFRIGLLVLGARLVFNIRDADELIAFYDNGHGPLAQL